MKRVNKILSLVICLAFCLGLLPAAALAEENSGDFSVAEEENTITESEPAEEPEPALPEEDSQTVDTPDAAIAVTEDGVEHQMATEMMETVVSDTDTAPDNGELFAGYVDQVFLGSAAGNNDIMLMSTETAGDQLTGQNKAIYNTLKAQIAQVASGAKASTVLTVPVSCLMSKFVYTKNDFGQNITEDNLGTLYKSLYSYSTQSVINSLLADCSYELYWYAKTTGCASSPPGYSYYINEDDASKSYIRINSSAVITFYMAVCPDYAGSATYTTSSGKTFYVEINQSKITAVNWAATNAKQIVMDASEKTDYSKLVYYREQICALTSYNKKAEQGLVSYGDPWQLIYVFDGDPDTMVVCEGYSKAFQYLCEMTKFDSSEIYSITVTGTMTSSSGSGAHMWNVVHMPDGDNYLVDVTNCDTGTTGWPDNLFLCGYSSATTSGAYCISISGQGNITYAYSSSDTIGVYPDSALVLSTNSFYSDSVTEVDHTWSDWDVDLSAGTRIRTCTTCQKTETCVLGDADRSGSVDMKDVVDLKRYLAGCSPTVVHTDSADLDGDGELTLKELLILKRQIADA